MLVVTIGWVFFRAPSLSSAVSYLKCMIGIGGSNPNSELTAFYLLEYVIMIIIGCICALPIVGKIKKMCVKYSGLEIVKDICLPITVVVLLMVSVSLLLVTENNPFIYFNF